MGKNKNKNKKDESSNQTEKTEQEEVQTVSTVGDSSSNADNNSQKEEVKSETGSQNSEMKEESKISQTNEGVKILEEVLSKAQIVPQTKETKGQIPIGPSIPTENDFDPEVLQKAEQLKEDGNEHFKNGKYEQALDAYSEAIFLNVPPKKKAVYYCNRALVSIKTENYALALFDAKDAIKHDEMYVKAYYRRGSAYLALNQIDLALRDFKAVCKMQPSNKDAREKYDEVMKEHRLRELQKCLGYAEEKVVINADEIEVEKSYTGPRFEKSTDEITPEWCVSLMQWQKDRKTLHKKYAVMLIQKAKEIFEKDKSLVDVAIGDDEEITVCGDIHGQYYDMLNIFAINGNPSKTNPYLFNGDFVDRGSFSVEVIMTLIAWKVCLPNHFFLNRGNHETKQLNKLYGFFGEVKFKYDAKIYELFCELFQYLPISYCLNKKVFVTHGGLFQKDGVKLDDIRKTLRVKEPGDEGILVDCLWSDPCDINGRHPSKRGISCMFGPDITEKFCTENNINLVVRAHEVKMEGYEYQKGGKCLTIFSAPNYCDQMGNKAAIARFKGATMEPKIITFDKVDHPKIPPMAYSTGFSGLF